MSNDKNYLSGKITGYIPVLTLISLVFGIVSLASYYSYFGINILSYLELNEIIFRTARDLVFVVGGGIFGYIITGKQYEEYVREDDEKWSKIEATYSSTNLINLILSDLSLKITFWVLFIIEIVLIVSFEVGWLMPKAFWIAFGMLWMVIGLTFSTVEVKRRYFIKYRRFPNSEIILFVRLLVIVCLGGMMMAYLEVERVERRNKEYQTTIIVNNETIKSNSRYFYLGKTNSYVFFYNDSTNVAEIFPMSSISKLSLRE